MKNLLSEKAVSTIKDLLQTELLKRGILAPIKRIEEVESRSGSNYISFNTEKFQTTPVIFKSLVVENFNSWIKKVEGGYEVTISVHYSYEHFDGGSNGCSLFNFQCNVSEESMYVGGVKIF
jgi:hypothetical protein